MSTSQRPDVRLQTAIADPQPSDARPVTVSVVVQPGDPPGAPPRRRQSAGPVSMSSERQPGFLPRPQRERSRSYFPSPHSHRAYSPYPYHHPSRSISSRRRRSSTSTLSAPRHAHHISRSPSPVGWYGSRPYGPSRYHAPGPTVVPVQAVVEPSYSYYNAAYPQTPSYNYPQTSGYNYTQTPDYNYFDWHKIAAGSYIYAFLLDTLPNQVYLHLLLRLPRLYFSRVTKIFEEADLSIPEIKNMVMEAARQGQDVSRGFTKLETVPDPPFANLKNMWETFIDSLMEEWRTLNIVSVLLLSAILTILQIDSAGTDPLTRYSALISLICALMSLLYGCMYIIRFGTMRKTHKAAVWASEGEDQKNFRIWWNFWVFLAMPAVWLAWSLILYIVCIMSFVWRAGIVSGEETVLVTSRDVLWPRIVISVVLGIGCIYFVLIISTLREYGDKMDNKWLETVRIWTNADSKITPTVPLVYPSYKSRSRSHSTSERQYSSTSPSRKTSSTPSMNTNRSSSSPSKSPTRSPDIPIIMTRAPLSSAKKVISKYSGTLSIPQEIRDCCLTDKEWDDLVLDVKAVHENINERKLQTQDETETRLQKNIAYLLRTWNKRTLSKCGLQAITLESEENNPDDIGGPFPAVYIADLPYVGDDEKKYSQARY